MPRPPHLLGEILGVHCLREESERGCMKDSPCRTAADDAPRWEIQGPEGLSPCGTPFEGCAVTIIGPVMEEATRDAWP